MITRCAYCNDDILSELESQPDNDRATASTNISHGMCKDCRDHFMKQWNGITLNEYLGDFDCPVMVVSAEGRIIGANQQSLTLLNKSAAEVAGSQGGDVMECAYARLPGGCGQTVHCSTCTIRNLVRRVHETHIDEHDVPATLTRKDSRVAFLLSAIWNDAKRYVELHIRQATPL